MEPHVLLAQLKSLLERAPDFALYAPASREHQIWLAQAHALVSRWDLLEATMLKTRADFLATLVTRNDNISKIFGVVHRAIADLELRLPKDMQESFGAGDVYDFFNSLNKVIFSAEKSIFIIDPYLDYSVFDHYLTSRKEGVVVRLMTSNSAGALVPHAQKYVAQHGAVLEVRKSPSIHDRVIFIDGHVCWFVGQSIKDAAKEKPTYLVQGPPDIVSGKMRNYENLWKSAVPL